MNFPRACSTAMVLAASLTVSAGALATPYNNSPMVDIPADQRADYDQDLYQCKELVEDTQGGNKQSTKKRGRRSGAALGALGGLAVAKASDGNVARGAGKGLAWGAAAGGLSGRLAGDSVDAQDSGYALRMCLEGRGYSVLDFTREDRRADSSG